MPKFIFSLHRKFSKMPPNLSLPFADQTFLFFSILHQVFFQKIVISKLRFHVNTAPGLLQKHLLKTKFSQKMLFKTYFSHQYCIRSSSKLTFLVNIASGLPQNWLKIQHLLDRKAKLSHCVCISRETRRKILLSFKNSKIPWKVSLSFFKNSKLLEDIFHISPPIPLSNNNKKSIE